MTKERLSSSGQKPLFHCWVDTLDADHWSEDHLDPSQPRLRMGIDLKDGSCPQRCITCKGSNWHGLLRTGLNLLEIFNYAHLEALLNTLASDIYQEFVFSGLPGEPLNPGNRKTLLRTLYILQDRGIPVRINTSGLIAMDRAEMEELKSKGVDRLAVSLNAVSPSQHATFTRTDEQTFLHKIEFIKKAVSVFGPDSVILTFLDLNDERLPEQLQALAVSSEEVEELIERHNLPPQISVVFRSCITPETKKDYQLLGLDEGRSREMEESVRLKEKLIYILRKAGLTLDIENEEKFLVTDRGRLSFSQYGPMIMTMTYSPTPLKLAIRYAPNIIICEVQTPFNFSNRGERSKRFELQFRNRADLDSLQKILNEGRFGLCQYQKKFSWFEGFNPTKWAYWNIHREHAYPRDSYSSRTDDSFAAERRRLREYYPAVQACEILGRDFIQKVQDSLGVKGDWTNIHYFPLQLLRQLPPEKRSTVETLLIRPNLGILAETFYFWADSAGLEIAPCLNLDRGRGPHSSRTFFEASRDRLYETVNRTEVAAQPCFRENDRNKGDRKHLLLFTMLTADFQFEGDKSDNREKEHIKNKIEVLETWLSFLKVVGIYPKYADQLEVHVCKGGKLKGLDFIFPRDTVVADFFERKGIKVVAKEPIIRETAYFGLEPSAGLMSELYLRRGDELIELGLFIDMCYDVLDADGELFTPKSTEGLTRHLDQGLLQIRKEARDWFSTAWGAERLLMIMQKKENINSILEKAMITEIIRSGNSRIPEEDLNYLGDLVLTIVLLMAEGADLRGSTNESKRLRAKLINPFIDELTDFLFARKGFAAQLEGNPGCFFRDLFNEAYEVYIEGYLSLIKRVRTDDFKEKREDIVSSIVDYCMENFYMVNNYG